MDHAEVRELLELAAVEPDGLERLAAGDTAQAAAIAGHLAGCPACAEEARRLAVVHRLVREAVTTAPPPELRARTLELVREVGRPRRRPAAVPDAAPSVAPPPAALEPATGAPAPAADAPLDRTRRAARWPAALAAVLVLALVGGGLLSARLIADQREHADALAELSIATLRVGAEPDVLRVNLVASAGGVGAASGTILFSATTEELVVTAPGLSEPGSGRVFACWVLRDDGSRARMGTMDFGGGLAYWDGWSDDLKGAGPGTTFGVTLVDSAGHRVEPGDVLTGTAEQD